MGKKIIIRVDTSDGSKLLEKDWLVHAYSEAISDFLTVCGLAPDYLTESDFGNFVGSELVTKPITCISCTQIIEETKTFRKKNGKWY